MLFVEYIRITLFNRDLKLNLNILGTRMKNLIQRRVNKFEVN